MVIIALQGKGNVGKSTTLKTFLKEILSKYSISATEYKLDTNSEDGCLEANCLKKEIEDENVDIYNHRDVKNHTVSFEISGEKIGLTTYGDTEWHIKQALECLSDCKIVFCACRTKGAGYNYLYDNYVGNLVCLGKSWFHSKDKNLSQYFMNYTNKKQIEILWEIFRQIVISD